MSAVQQVVPSTTPYDAVNAQAIAYDELLEEWGLGGGIWSGSIEPAFRTPARPLSRMQPDPDDLLLIHYSAYVPSMRGLLELPNRKLLVFHNVTPARYYWNFHARVALVCELSRDQLPSFARAATVAAGVSEYNARELEEAGAGSTRVVPILVDREALGAGGAASRSGPPLVLAVGRLAPHKRHDLVIRAFALYQRECAPDARLMCIGTPLTPAYRERLVELADEVDARNVELPGRLPQEELNAAYRSASVALSLSEHEGFCVPLLEAFHFGVPVIARPAAAMPEVGGDAVLWTGDADLATAAELIDLAVRDEELRAELRRRGRERLEHYAPQRVAEALRGAVEEALSR